MKRSTSTTLALLATILSTAWLLAPLPAAAADEETDTATGSEPAPAAKPPARQRPAGARGTRATWWNEPKIVEDLTLTEKQRKEMDEIYQKYLEGRPNPTQRGSRREPFIEALTAGDMTKAKKELDELAAETSAPVKAHGELKIHVLSLLTKDQRAKLAETHKDVISRTWVPRAGGMAGGPRGQRQARRPGNRKQ